MSLTNHIDHLKSLHWAIQKEIEYAELHHLPYAELKKQRLFLLEEITRLEIQ